MERSAARIIVFPLVLALVVALAASGAGCASRTKQLSGDPLTDFQNPELRTPQRLAAMRSAWDDPNADRSSIRGPLKDLAWSDQTPREIRHQALDLLLSDDSRLALRDTYLFIQSRVPTERDYDIIRKMGVKAVAQSWSDLTPSFVRSYAIADTNIADAQRVEKAILESLNPDQPLALIVTRVFLKPNQGALGTPGANNYIDLDAKAREAAWELLARIDPTGEARRDVLTRGDLSTDETGAGILDSIRRGMDELGVVPRNGEELRWLLALAREPDGVWWAQTASAVAQLTDEQAWGLKLRNLEALRWASLYRETWMRDDRAQLEGRVRARLDDREPSLRRADTPDLRGVPQTFEQAADRLTWGDLMSVMAVDVALHDPGVAGRLFEQADMDLADETTEYGGLIFVDAQGRFVAQLYPPRPQHRKGDDQFVASSDMIEQSVRALAMYHFHAMRERNSRFAGPSAEDYANARTFGRLAVVLTSINKDELNADAYLDTPASIDLGQRPRTPAFVGQP